MNSKLALIAIPKEHIESLVYAVPVGLDVTVGAIVTVPLRDKILPGIVIELLSDSNTYKYHIKHIIQNLGVSVSSQYLNFLNFAANYYCVPLGSAIKAAIPNQIKSLETTSEAHKAHNIALPILSLEQKDAFEQLAHIVKTQQHNTALLHGVTGSGKTAIYLHLALDYLQKGQQVLILLPEIGLIPQMLSEFYKAFKITPIVWHSKVTTKAKIDAFQQITLGTASIIIGVRSALFLPYKHLGLIIVDEEHDQSYKQESHFCYNARDMAVLRGFLCKTFVLLGSATPSIETYQNVLTKQYGHVTLNKRFAEAKMPKVEILNMQNKPNKSWLCTEMYEKITLALKNGNQVLLFLNRRGYAPLVLCSNCGLRQKCKQCSTWLVFHKNQALLRCHHCGDAKPIPKICLECKAQDSTVACGPGVERIAEELQEKLPQYKIAILSRDRPYEKTINLTLQNFAANKIDILIGTQIITKGHHFPNLTTVGILDADAGLGGENIRSLENTFQLLHQVGGRSGREKHEGTVYVQTYFPNSKFMRLVKNNDFLGFINWELQQRKNTHLPPFSKVVKILILSSNKLNAEKYASEIKFKHPENHKVRLLGPVDARIAQISNEHRIKMLLIVEKDVAIKDHIEKWLKTIKKPNKVRIKIDVDPYDLS